MHMKRRPAVNACPIVVSMRQAGSSDVVGSERSSTLLILVGPKGSGKTHIGTVLERHLGIRFLRVEPIFRAHRNGPGAMAEVEREIDRALAEAGVVAIESTGAAPDLVEYWRGRYEHVVLARVCASDETCFRRFLERDASAHIPVSDDRFREVNERAAQASFDWDCELDNERALTDEDIVRAISAVL